MKDDILLQKFKDEVFSSSHELSTPEQQVLTDITNIYIFFSETYFECAYILL